jgi:hypothetical protein
VPTRTRGSRRRRNSRGQLFLQQYCLLTGGITIKVPTTASGDGAAGRIDDTAYTCVEDEGGAQSWRKRRSYYRTARCHSSSIDFFHCINQYQHQSRTSGGAFYQRVSSALYTLHEQE